MKEIYLLDLLKTIIKEPLSLWVTIAGIVVYFYISINRNRTELKMIQIQLEQKYSTSLFEKRIELYPSLSEILSGYQKKILYGDNTEENFMVFIKELDIWNTKNSIFFSRETAKFSSGSRLFLRSFLNKIKNQNASDSNGKLKNKLSEKDWEAIYQVLGDFEISLRADIRMFHEKTPGNVKDRKKIINSLEKRINNLPKSDSILPFKSTKLKK
jgi:hypothetical protein